jgi:subtilisin family serine protease
MNSARRLAALAGITLLASGCAGFFGGLHHYSSGGSGSGGSGGSSPDAYDCPTSDSASSIARVTSLRPGAGARGRALAHTVSSPVQPNLLAVTYDARTFAQNPGGYAAREQSAGATFVREYDFTHAGLVTRIVRPSSGSLASLEAALRALPGVRNVGATGYHRHLDSVSQPYVTNDPIFDGDGASAPLYETSSTEGQWDMHAARLEYAFAYSQSGNGSSVTNANALGSSNIKVAIVDSGVDTSQPDLENASGNSKVVYRKCYITDPDGAQSTSSHASDPSGHGTNVAGLAAAEPNNAFGFAGAGGNVSIDAYRIFPTPDDTCITDVADQQCTTNSADIASAIEDAVAQKVNVINLSFGDSSCTTAGVDDDSVEGNAVADAIAANIVVVASAGDDGENALQSPACDTGVIAVGATGLSDGTTNGSVNTSGSATNPREYVASYSDYGEPGKLAGNASAWGIVAPGGDPSSTSDEDDLHFIENIWTSTPFDSNFQAATCLPDSDISGQGTDDCRTFTYGTSISAPIVAGAAALVLSVNGNYQSPAKMKQLLCSTADDVGDADEGCGRLDIYRAMAVALHDQTEPAPRPTP